MMQPIPGDTQSAGLEITGVDYLPEYVIGFPIYVAITVQAQPDVWFNLCAFRTLRL
jgi:hypothetical protein